MAQVVLMIDGEKIRQRGMHAPKKNKGVENWVKDILELFAADLESNGWDAGKIARMKAHGLFRNHVDENEIRLAWVFDHKVVSFLVNRTANALAT